MLHNEHVIAYLEYEADYAQLMAKRFPGPTMQRLAFKATDDFLYEFDLNWEINQQNTQFE